MSSSADREVGRVGKREYLTRVARRAGVSNRVASSVYQAAIDEILEIVGKGDRLTLTGFGKFYPQDHKGHRVRLADGSPAEIDDYSVLKFSATRAMNRRTGLAKARHEE